MDGHNPAVECPRIAIHPANQAGHHELIEEVLGALYITLTGSLISLLPTEHGEMDSASMVYLILCLITFTLGLLLLYVSITDIRLPLILANYFGVGNRDYNDCCVALVPSPIHPLIDGNSEKAKQQGKCIIPVSDSSLPSFVNGVSSVRWVEGEELCASKSNFSSASLLKFDSILLQKQVSLY